MPTPDSFGTSRLTDQNVEPTIIGATKWIKYPYGIMLDSDPTHVLQSIVDIENWINEGEFPDKSDPDYAKTIEEYGKVLQDSLTDDTNVIGGSASDKASVNSEIIEYFTKPIPADTRVGCNDAINPYWQFNRDDDIRQPSLVDLTYAARQSLDTDNDRYVSELEHASGMGRVYESMYDSQQQILWIEAGVPRFTNLLSYYRDVCRDASVAEAINSGNMARKCGQPPAANSTKHATAISNSGTTP